ncbi:beta strand repeat-containing protein, partial [Campylobacter concisus]|uniref:beta strand repeat-containing protein n=1 Tax=Campylobacter concisus TaxID=199 RepID=UPI00131EB038
FAEGGHISNINANVGSIDALSLAAGRDNSFGVSGGSAVGAGAGATTPKVSINISSAGSNEGGVMTYDLSLPTALTARPTTLNLNFSGGVAGVDYDANSIEYSTDGGNTWTRGTTVNLADANQINNVKVRVATIDNYGHEGVDIATNPAAQSANQNQGERDGSKYSNLNGVEYGVYKRNLTLNVTTDNDEIINSQANGKITDNDDYVNINEGLSEAVFTGDGDDTVNMSGAFSDVNSYVSTEDGDDVINVKSGSVLNYGNAQIDAGDGNDTINLNQGSFVGISGSSGTRIYGGDGDDTFNMNGEIKGGLVYGDDGDDTFNVGSTGVLKDGATIYANEGNDTINFDGTAENGTQIQGNEGYDTINIKSGAVIDNSSVYGDDVNENSIFDAGNEINIDGTVRNNSSVYGGAGADTVNINGTVENSYISTRDGNDIININSGAHINGGLGINIGKGNDIVNINAGANLSDVSIKTGADHSTTGDNNDNDTVNIKGGTFSETKIELGGLSSGGTNTVNIDNKDSGQYFGDQDDSSYDKTSITAHWGANAKDIINIKNYSTVKNTKIELHGNDDQIHIGANATVEHSKLITGDQSDTLTIGEKAKIGNGTHMHLGFHNDTVEIGNEATIDNSDIYMDDGDMSNPSTFGNDTVKIGNNVTFKNYADVKGGQGSDEITIGNNLTLDGNAGIYGDWGEAGGGVNSDNDGNDIITIGDNLKLQYNSTVSGGGGNDIITIGKNLNISGGSTISGGDGNDTITINGGDEAYLNTDSVISGGAGNDEIYIKDGTKASSSLILGDGENTQKPGNDKITISGDNTVLDNVKIDAGDGDVTDTVNGPKDIININGGKIITSGVISGNGNDEITINGNTIMEGGYIDSGSGNDKINIAGKTSMDGGYHRTGSGEDIVTITDNANLSRVILDGEEDNDTINITGNAKVKNSFIGAGAGADDKINISGNAEIDTATLKLGTSAYNGGKATDKTTLNVTGDAVLNDVHIGADESLGEQYMNFHQNGEAKISKIDGSNNKDIIDIKGGNFTITDAFPDGKIYGNGGDDEIKIRDGATAKIKADMGDGVDTLTVSNATLKDSTVDMGNGNDIVNINTGATIDNVSINTGAGVGTVNINAGATVKKVDITTGAENDIVNINSDITAPATTPATQSNIRTGAGSDEVNIASGVTLTRTVVEMGAGEDTIELKGNSATDRITFKGSTLYTDDAGYLANDVDHVTISNTTFIKSDDGRLSSVLTGGGDDVITVKDGTLFQDFSYIAAGNGKDTITLESGAKFDQASVRADAGDDTINVNGAEFQGQNGNPNAGIHGGDGNDQIFVNSGTFNNAVINGDAGNDLISVKQGVSLNNTTIDGGAGYDTLKVADDSLDFSKVKNIEKLDLTEGNHNINLSAKEVLDMTDDNNKLRIGGDSNDNLDLVSKGWVASGTTTTDENGINYNVYTNIEGGKTVTLEVQDQVHVF